MLSLGIGLCVNQTRAVLEALFGRETEFVRTPKHGIRRQARSPGRGKKYRAAKSLTPFIEMGLAAYFVVAIVFAFDHRHYVSLPFLGLFLCGFAYVGWGSLTQGPIGAGLGARLGRLFARQPAGLSVVPPPGMQMLASQGATQNELVTRSLGGTVRSSVVNAPTTAPHAG